MNVLGSKMAFRKSPPKHLSLIVDCDVDRNTTEGKDAKMPPCDENGSRLLNKVETVQSIQRRSQSPRLGKTLENFLKSVFFLLI